MSNTAINKRTYHSVEMSALWLYSLFASNTFYWPIVLQCPVTNQGFPYRVFTSSTDYFTGPLSLLYYSGTVPEYQSDSF